jgi:phosphoglycerate dehydrogenase-like enzyme
MILLLESVHPEALAMLEELGEPVVFSELPDTGEYSDWADLRAIVTRGIGQISNSSFDEHPELEVVARCGVGLDNIDTEAAARANVPVVHAPGSTTYAVAEHALMLMLALARKVTELDSAVKAGNWGIREGYEGTEMRGKRLGVVGLGAIGSRVAEFGAMLGMDVVCVTRRERTGDITRVPLDELLRTSDVVQLCVPLTDQTRGLIGTAQLEMMKCSALLINTARGALVVNSAVEQALEAGLLAGYAADVSNPEPPDATDEIVVHPRSVVTPHIAALTDVTYREICVRTVAAVVAVLTGVEPDPACVYRGATG